MALGNLRYGPKSTKTPVLCTQISYVRVRARRSRRMSTSTRMCHVVKILDTRSSVDRLSIRPAPYFTLINKSYFHPLNYA